MLDCLLFADMISHVVLLQGLGIILSGYGSSGCTAPCNTHPASCDYCGTQDMHGVPQREGEIHGAAGVLVELVAPVYLSLLESSL